MTVDFSDVPMAHRFELFFCGECPNGHVIFFDKADKPILHSVFSAHLFCWFHLTKGNRVYSYDDTPLYVDEVGGNDYGKLWSDKRRR